MLEDVAVYGYITPMKIKIVLTLALTDDLVRDADIISVSLRIVFVFINLQRRGWHLDVPGISFYIY